MTMAGVLARPIPVRSGRLHRTAGYYPELAGALAVVILTILFAGATPSPDVAWQLWIAHHLRMSARFYVDILETNPPLWFWMAIPVDWLARAVGMAPERMLVLATGFAGLLSIVATGRVSSHIPAPVRAALLVYAALIFLFMPLSDMGQREQFVLIGALPYAALIAARRERRAVPVAFAFSAGVGAALGFALKHYFLIVPVSLELWLLAAHRSGYRPIRPETIAVVLVGLLYAGAVLLFAPAFLTTMLPMLRLTYAAMETHDWQAMMRPPQWIWIVMLALLSSHPRLSRGAPFATALVIASGGFAVAWLIQFKGWPYHAIATSGCLALALAALLAEAWPRTTMPVRMLAPTVLALPLAYAVLLGPYRNVLEPLTRPLLAGLRPGDSVAFVTTQSAFSWPLVNERGFRYPSRYYTFWMLHAVVERGNPRDPRLEALGRRISAETALDFRCIPPDRILFERGSAPGTGRPVTFDMLQFFGRDPAFAELMRHYARVRQTPGLDVYQRITTWPMLPASACRRGV